MNNIGTAVVKLDNRLTLLYLARQDEGYYLGEKSKFYGKTLLDELSGRLGKLGKDTCNLHDEFFVLGKASKAYFFSINGLYEIAELCDLIHSVRLNIIRSRKIESQMGAFESHTSPAIEVMREHARSNGIIPCLFFCRTSETIRNLQEISSEENLIKNVARVMIGLGAYDLIFYIKTKTLTELNHCVSSLRNNLKQFWETTTIVGVPPKHLKDEERRIAASEPYHRFSILARYSGKITREIEDAVVRLAHMEEFSQILSPLLQKRESITFRQGRMDLIIPCHSQTVSDVFDLACELRRRVRGIIRTATVAKLELC